MQAPRPIRMNVHLATASGRIIRPIVLTDASVIKAKARAARLAPKPGQSVLAVEVVR